VSLLLDTHASRIFPFTTLAALGAQTLAPFEIIVPYDDPCADVATLVHDFPAVRFLRAAGLDTRSARAGGRRRVAAGQV
jgi:hypothetical protein